MALNIIGLEGEPEGHQLFNTADWDRTLQAHHWFKEEMFKQLCDKQEKGKGYFEEACVEDLHDALERCLQDGKYADAANYAMMLAFKAKVGRERQDFAMVHIKKEEERRAKLLRDEDSEFF